MIKRKELITRHNPVLKKIEIDSPLTVGNGNFAFTTDPTGMQSLYQLFYENNIPLCTMAQWGWHTEPVGDGRPNYTLADVDMTGYEYEDRKIYLPIDKKIDSAEAYQWLRQNPHRPNLARIALTVDEKEIVPEQLSAIQQELHLYEGRLESSFCLDGKKCQVTTVCDGKTDTLGFQIETEHEGLEVMIAFPYGSYNSSGSDWNQVDKHETVVSKHEGNQIKFKCIMDDFIYCVTLNSDHSLDIEKLSQHKYNLITKSSNWNFTIRFEKLEANEGLRFKEVMLNSQSYWKGFWSKVGVVDFKDSNDPRARELERRVILSQYLLAIQSSGDLPPQETGLTCNSWHGKFHLEMHLWHSAWLPLWNQKEMLERSIPWYNGILDKAIYNANKNGFKGARWPKQVAYDGIDSPSPIAPLLIWQQSHIIYLLELIYEQGRCTSWLRNHWELVKQSADFMCDYLSWNADVGCYELIPPIIPAQEEHDPKVVKNPTFEIEYWRFSLQIAIKWANRLGEVCDNWQAVVTSLAESPKKDGLYLAHEYCPDTFRKFNRDHPSMLGVLGLIANDRIDRSSLKNTVNKVLECWEFESMWGWDFALMAMCAVRLGESELAMDILLMDSPKNDYVISGNNYQRMRSDLPLYLPGNGSLLLAVALMVAGYNGCNEKLPGIPKNGDWEVEFENISPFPY